MANSAFEIAVEAYIAEHGSIDRETMDSLRTVYETSDRTARTVSYQRSANYHSKEIDDDYEKEEKALKQHNVIMASRELEKLIKSLQAYKTYLKSDKMPDLTPSTMGMQVDDMVKTFKHNLKLNFNALRDGAGKGTDEREKNSKWR